MRCDSWFLSNSMYQFLYPIKVSEGDHFAVITMLVEYAITYTRHTLSHARSDMCIFPPHSRITPIILGWGIADLICMLLLYNSFSFLWFFCSVQSWISRAKISWSWVPFLKSSCPSCVWHDLCKSYDYDLDRHKYVGRQQF